MIIPFYILIWAFIVLVLFVLATVLAAGINRVVSSSRQATDNANRARARDLLLSLSRESGEGRVKLLGRIRDFLSQETAEHVALALHRLDAPARRDVVELFETNGLVSHFIRLLKVGSKWNRAKAARILGELDLPVASAALYKSLDDRDPDVRNVAARSLSRLRHPMAQSVLISVLGKHEEPVSSRIAAMFIEAGAASVPLLVKNMRNDNWRARFWSAEILGQVGDQRSERVLVAALKDTSADVRSAAAKALGKTGTGASVEHLVPLLKDEEWFVRSHAAWALGKLRAVDAMGELAQGLRDKSWWMRKTSLEALAELGDSAIPALMRVLEGDDKFARESALEALQKLGVEVRSGEGMVG
ncbi:MAG: HEAT repeat domain-containing protein [Candidatus Eisenbacteria bacterium]|nr:HEAT repeat domain-containing protein [Candidatus Eisenbacteria bacterium]